MTTPHKSFEERVDEVLDDIIGAAVLHVSKMKDHDYDFKYINDRYNEAKAALLAAHKEEVERVIGEDHGAAKIGPMSRMSQTMAEIMVIEDDLRAQQRTRANLTDDHEGLSDRVGW